MSLRSRLVGSALLVVAVAAFALAADIAPAAVPESAAAAADVSLIAPSPFSLVGTPLLFAVGSVLLVGGAAALAGTDLSARVALLAPGLGAVAGFVVVTGVAAAPAAVLGALTEPDALTTALAGWPGAIAAGTVVGGAVAPVVQATVTEDTPTLLAGSVLLLAALAAGASDPLPLVTGGLGGVAAVGVLWAVDPARWRP